MAAQENQERPRPRLVLLIQVFLVVIFVAVGTIGLEQAGWLRGFEHAAIDAWLRARLNLTPPPTSNQIVIVSITERDYNDIFQARSPLKKDALKEIITAIASAKPATIGIDLDTSAEEFMELQFSKEIPLVWAEDAVVDESNRSKVVVGPALGGANLDPSATGIAVMPMESDGVVRSYIRRFGKYNSLEWALVRRYCAWVTAQIKPMPPIELDPKIVNRCDVIHGMAEDAADSEELTFDLLGGDSRFQHISAREVLDAYKGSHRETLDKMSGRVVLLGGVFHAARDEYNTPIGRMSGVGLMAHAIDSELRGGGFRRPREVTMLVLNLIGGIGILLLFIGFGVKRGCLFSLLAILFIAPLWSWIAFGSVTFAVYFMVILLALLIHQLYEQAHYIQHKWLHRLKAKQGKPKNPRPST
jgi:CHASE2 domain-containing sensor protein